MVRGRGWCVLGDALTPKGSSCRARQTPAVVGLGRCPFQHMGYMASVCDPV